MSEKDDAAALYYADPAHRTSDSPGHALPERPERLSRHVPIRFDRETIAAIKQFSDEDGMTVSSWVRRLVAREIQRRTSLRARTTRQGAAVLHLDRRAGQPATSASGASHAEWAMTG